MIGVQMETKPQYNTVAGASVMLALLPTQTDWCKIKLPHMTLVYAGEIDKDVRPTDFNVLAKDACSIAQMSSPFAVKVIGKEVFGDEDKVDVLCLEPVPILRAMRHFVERWNASQYKEFKPHCTIGPEGSFVENLPMYLSFDRVAVGWGEELLTFNLR